MPPCVLLLEPAARPEQINMSEPQIAADPSKDTLKRGGVDTIHRGADVVTTLTPFRRY